MTQAIKGDGQNIDVNIYTAGWARGCRAVEPERPYGVQVARIYLQLFPPRFWSITVCFCEALPRSPDAINKLYEGGEKPLIPEFCAKAEPT